MQRCWEMLVSYMTLAPRKSRKLNFKGCIALAILKNSPQLLLPQPLQVLRQRELAKQSFREQPLYHSSACARRAVAA